MSFHRLIAVWLLKPYRYTSTKFKHGSKILRNKSNKSQSKSVYNYVYTMCILVYNYVYVSI